MSGRASVLELYCGIGGCAAALARTPSPARVVAALDINDRALGVYRRNFPGHRALQKTLDALRATDLERFGANTWWLSPPCQPFTRRGMGRDADDPRSRSLLHLIGLIAEVRPAALVLENVPGFDGSRVHGRLREVLDRSGYHVRETVLCPTELGLPNRRRRFYLAARRAREPGPWGPRAWRRGGERARGRGPRLGDLIERDLNHDVPPDLAVDPALPGRYPHALHVVDADDPDAITACFTAAYGRSPVRSGSYLRLPGGGLRRFAPTEILRLLGFSDGYTLPAELSARKAWPLVGNSLSVPAVRAVLEAVV